MSNRRRFIAGLGSGAAALALAKVSSASAAATGVSSSALSTDDESAHFTSQSAADLAASASFRELSVALDHQYSADEWDLTWTQRLTGKHRAVFDTPEVEHAVGVLRSGLWLKQYGEVLKAPPSELNSVVVLRHHAIILAMSQPFWDEHNIGKKNKVTDPITDKVTSHNPALLGEATGAPPSYAAFALDKQIANGTIVLACGLAFGDMISLVSEKYKIKGAEANARAREGLVPGVILQPSGFFATTMAGENGCVYVRAS